LERRLSLLHVRTRQQGFTLLEVLVTMVIIGIIVAMGMVALSFGNSATRLLDEESERISVLIRLASEEASLQSREFALSFWRGGYGFHELDGEDWQLIENDELLRPRELPEGLQLRLFLEDVDTRLSLVEKHEPQVFILSSGEVSPFAVVLELEDGPSQEIAVDLLGRIEIDELDTL
jgi:general secretion pathway protein H